MCAEVNLIRTLNYSKNNKEIRWLFGVKLERLKVTCLNRPSWFRSKFNEESFIGQGKLSGWCLESRIFDKRCPNLNKFWWFTSQHPVHTLVVSCEYDRLSCSVYLHNLIAGIAESSIINDLHTHCQYDWPLSLWISPIAQSMPTRIGRAELPWLLEDVER